MVFLLLMHVDHNVMGRELKISFLMYTFLIQVLIVLVQEISNHTPETLQNGF